MLCVCGRPAHTEIKISTAITDQPQPLLSRCICAEVKSHYFRETNKQWRCQFVNQFFMCTRTFKCTYESHAVDFSLRERSLLQANKGLCWLQRAESVCQEEKTAARSIIYIAGALLKCNLRAGTSDKCRCLPFYL